MQGMCMGGSEREREREAAKPIASRADVWPTSFFGPLRQHHQPSPLNHPPSRILAASTPDGSGSRPPYACDCPPPRPLPTFTGDDAIITSALVRPSHAHG